MEIAGYSMRSTPQRMVHHPTHRHYIRGDGNCLFRCIAHKVYQDQDKYMVVKQNIWNFVDANRKRAFQKETYEFWCTTGSEHGFTSMEQYRDWILREGVYGGYLEIAIAAKCFKLSIYVYVDGKEFQQAGYGINRINLEYINKCHYQILE